MHLIGTNMKIYLNIFNIINTNFMAKFTCADKILLKEKNQVNIKKKLIQLMTISISSFIELVR